MRRSKNDPGWALHRRGKTPKVETAFVSSTKVLPSEDASNYIAEYKKEYPVEAYATEVQQWTKLPGGKAKVIMRRYPSAD